MKKLLFIFVILIFILNHSNGQGCVALKSTGAVCTKNDAGSQATAKGWQLNINYRYFKSFRHYRERHEEKERVEKGSDVRNFSHSLDLGLVRTLNSRWSLGLNLPILATRRSSLYEHDGKTRHSTFSFGIGDMRIAAYRWMLDPAKNPKGNVQLGLGVKLPTGDYRYQDFFYKNDSTTVLGPVDQSIQLGDGGTGLTTEINAYYNFSRKVSVYGSFYYLLNPREQNGVSLQEVQLLPPPILPMGVT
jgi:predicted porin